MNSKLAKTIIFSLLALVLVSTVSAEWKKYTFFPRKDVNDVDGATYATELVTFWVNHNGYDSRFTIYKPNVAGLRVYINIEGVSWQAFQQYMIFGGVGGELTMPDGRLISFGGIDMTKLYGQQSKVEIKMIMSQEFLRLYHRNPSIGIRIIGQPNQTAGRHPDVEVDVEGSVINVVKVDYPRAAVNITANGTNFVGTGAVTVKQTGDGRQSSIGGVMVRGGNIKKCESVRGIGKMVVKGKRFKKTLINGGTFTDNSTTEGKIGIIYCSNGLQKKFISGNDYAPNGVRKVVAVRGGDGAEIIAGGDTTTPIGTIGKIVVNLKPYGQFTTLNNCKFYSYALPKVKICKKATIAGVVGCTVTTPNGTFPIDATYKNLVK